ncbi:MAG: hypothetical protein SFY69_05060 [Planctomycetota bacterium]|nr:hypothetical protein [Planctomycetota bacterium]
MGDPGNERGAIRRVPPAASDAARVLPSGRTVEVGADERGERIEVRSPDGVLEIAIALTAQGPVLQVRGARLEIESTDAVALKCREFSVHADEGMKLSTGGTLDVRAQGEIGMTTMADARLDAAVIHLNCGDRSAYPDGQPGYVPPVFELPALPAVGPAVGPAAPAGRDGAGECCGGGACGHDHA